MRSEYKHTSTVYVIYSVYRSYRQEDLEAHFLSTPIFCPLGTVLSVGAATGQLGEGKFIAEFIAQYNRLVRANSEPFWGRL